MKRIALLLSIIIGSLVFVPGAVAQEDNATQAINIAAQSPEVSEVLAGQAWEATAYEDSEGLWGVEFFMTSEEAEDPFLAWALVDIENSEVVEVFTINSFEEEPLVDEATATAAINIAAQSEDLSEVLAGQEWEAEVFAEGENIYGVDFFRTGDFDEKEEGRFLAWALVDIENGLVVETFKPYLLSEEELERLSLQVQALVLRDAEVAMVIGDPIGWNIEVYWDAFESAFYVSFYRGLDSYVALVYYTADDEEAGEFFFEAFFNEYMMDEAAAALERRDRAITLAFEADGIDDALAGYDDWETIVQEISETEASVEFVVGSERLFFALVDLENNQIIESEATR